MDLVIVESPTKAKTLGRFLEKNFRIVATMGHIRDLPQSKLGVDVAADFQPEYEIVEKRKPTVTELKKEAKKAQKIYLATDPDREGEAIAYHVYVICSNSKLKTQNSKLQRKIKKEDSFYRITFHEITKTAIEKALSHPGTINMQLVDAQQARRILDRLVGYKLSPLLWRKIRRGLSAGRVQSVAVRLIVDREREIEKFVAEEYWEIFAELKRHLGGQKPDSPTFLAKLLKKNGEKIKIEDEPTAKEIVAELERAGWEVGEVEEKEVKRRPPPPFTTSTLQQQAVYKLGFSGKRTMRAAQSLYEQGLITYHRTDSLALAAQAIDEIRSYISQSWGEKYLPEKVRVYKTRSKVAQEAHEAIRPTDVRKIQRGKDTKIQRDDEQKLYELIWKRTVACQMAAAIWDQTKVQVQAAGRKNIYHLLAEGRVMKFDGFLKLYLDKGEAAPATLATLRTLKGTEGTETENTEGGATLATLRNLKKTESTETEGTEGILPELKKGDELDLLKIDPQQKFTQPPPRYTEATLIKALEQRGIGRPSTYAPIISTIQDRQYVEKKEGKFHPSALGTTVNDFLVDYFSKVVDYDFTAQMEDNLDKIATGQKKWVPVIREFYEPFEKKLAGVTEVAERVQVPTEVTGEKCPKCKDGQLVIRVGRFGKFISCSRFPKCKYSANYTPKLEGVKCPKCGGEVAIKRSKKGRQFYGCANWPKCDWASWRKPK